MWIRSQSWFCFFSIIFPQSIQNRARVTEEGECHAAPGALIKARCHLFLEEGGKASTSGREGLRQAAPSAASPHAAPVSCGADAQAEKSPASSQPRPSSSAESCRLYRVKLCVAVLLGATSTDRMSVPHLEPSWGLKACTQGKQRKTPKIVRHRHCQTTSPGPYLSALLTMSPDFIYGAQS